MPEDRALSERMQLAALASLGEALTALAGRLRLRAVIAQEFIRLTTRARQIVGQAWDVQTSRWGFEENAARLAAALSGFADEVHAAAERTIAAVAGDAGMIDGLLAYAERIGRLREGDAGSASQVAIRAELAPLETMLVSLQVRAGSERQFSDEAAVLAKAASSLAARAAEIRGGGRASEQAAHEINAALMAFAADATAVSGRVAHSALGLDEQMVRSPAGRGDALVCPVEGPRLGQVWERIGGR